MVISYLKIGGVIAVGVLFVMLYLKAEYYRAEASRHESAVVELTASLDSAKSKILESQEGLRILENSNKAMEDRIIEAEGMLSSCANGYDKLRENLTKARNVPKQKVSEYHGIDYDSGAALLRQYNDDVNRLRESAKD